MCIGAGRDARADSITGARRSFTMITSLWGNGECGPIVLVVPLGFLKDKEVHDIRTKFEPHVFVISSWHTNMYS